MSTEPPVNDPSRGTAGSPAPDEPDTQEVRSGEPERTVGSQTSQDGPAGPLPPAGGDVPAERPDDPRASGEQPAQGDQLRGEPAHGEQQADAQQRHGTGPAAAHQAHGTQPYDGQGYGAAPYGGHQAPGQQPDGGQGYKVESYDQPTQGRALDGGDPYGARTHGQYTGQPYSAQPYGAQPYSAQPYGAQPYGQQPYGAQPYGQQNYDAQQPSGQSPYGAPRYGSAPYDAQPGGYPVSATGVPHGPSPDPLVPFSFGDWVSKVIGTVQRSWRPLAVIQVAVWVPIALLDGILTLVGLGATSRASTVGVPAVTTLATFGAIELLQLAVSVVLMALGSAASVFVVVRDAAQRTYDPHEVLAFARSRALAVVGWNLLAGLLVVLGLVALVVPGVYLAVVFIGALTGVVVVERAGMGRAFALVNPRFFPTFGRLALIAVLALVYGGLIGLLTSPFALTSLVLVQLLQNVLLIPMSVVATAALVVIYAENRFREHHPVHTPVLDGELDRP
ncbi:hypothetical protein WIS52_04975 [Pseudonocardia nematodicida]|uniref:Membrane domain of glycerophosphoryl diester phosphodiesterase n=1 Tax=Pseudonocardia nematodicida TaxID=1206997 RepID=A0ABV1K8X1_9PSEU